MRITKYTLTGYPKDEVLALIRFAARGIDTTGWDVEVTPTLRDEPFRGWAHRPRTYYKKRRETLADGCHTYERVHRRPKAQIRLGHRRWFPMTRCRYTKRSPAYELLSWQECVVMLAAHEFRHLQQFKYHRRASEVDCERWALGRLLEYRVITGGTYLAADGTPAMEAFPGASPDEREGLLAQRPAASCQGAG